MAEGIVHLLEAIQVDEQQRQRILRAARTLDLLLQPVEEQAAVGQIRERIEIRLVPDDFLRLALLGHVMDQRNAAALTIRVGQVGIHGQVGGKLAAVLAADREFAAPSALGCHGGPQAIDQPCRIACPADAIARAAPDLLGRIASGGGKGRIHVDDGAIERRHHHGLAAG
ncbi:hypothetical protein D3C72_1323520 [compost metagenome]